MASIYIHQAIHGYRDGHRLLSSSRGLGADAARIMLVLSDMSGPSMHPGFDEYLTGYPLPGTNLYVFAKTWYAPEMKRPGCVWTHSLLIPKEQLSEVSANRLVETFRRPQVDGGEKSADVPVIFETDSSLLVSEGFENMFVAAMLVSGVLGQSRPVVIAVDSVAQVQPIFLQIWDGLWSSAKARLTFCTGSLMPRTVAGVLMDLQAVPRAIPSSQFRKAASGALILDLLSSGSAEPWVEQVLKHITQRSETFRSWMEEVAGPDAGRGSAPSLVTVFGQWHQSNWSASNILNNVLDAPEIIPDIKNRLVEMVLNKAGAEKGARQRRELLLELCGRRETELSSITSLLEEQTHRLFSESRFEGLSLALSLLGVELTEIGEHVLRTAILKLKPNDLDAFPDSQASSLPTLLSVNHELATAPALWRRASSRANEMLSQLNAEKFTENERLAVAEAVIAIGRDAPINALVKFAGSDAVFRVLSALVAGELSFSTQWCSSISAYSDTVIEWLQLQPAISSRELEVASLFISPSSAPQRLENIWRMGTSASVAPLSPRVAVFGLALAFSRQGISPLFESCFQSAFNALASTHVEHEAWEWLKDLAPAVSWWRDWDRCERVAAALARRLAAHEVPLAIVFSIARTASAIQKVVGVLYANRQTKIYLKQLRKSCDTDPSLGSHEQRSALAISTW